MTFIHQTQNFSNKILLINGFNGTGKTILPPIIDAFSSTLIPSFAYEVEWFSNMFSMGILSSALLEELIHKLINYRVYNQILGREVNTRFHDLSSIFKSPKIFRYLKSLITKNDIFLLKHSPQLEHTLVLTITQAIDTFPVFSKVFQERLLFVEFMRDPLYMYLQTLILHKTVILGDSIKDFTFRYSHGAFPIPPFSSITDFPSNIQSLDEFLIHYFNVILEKWEFSLGNFNSASFMPFPFEIFVLQPDTFMSKLSLFITGSRHFPNSVKRALVKQSVPRSRLTAMSNIPIYKRYGFKNIKSTSLIQERQRYKEYLCNECNVPMSVVHKLSAYSNRYYNMINTSDYFSNFSPLISSLYGV